ncbi:pheromone-regulated K+ transporter prm6 [Gigaspora margarita]|uniref:Pheromone-regulated K+ transporter prm6 n=1 Tax=Gigaspora margarita TaxID=4874 RepID=A0A8H4ADA3_GIGMA|nr:pheromone-regulated K+ transporter prm6 [Gigaspora margarita]
MVKWKKERDLKVVKDFKYDFVDIQEFEKHDCLSKMRYSVVFFIVLKAVLVYIADLYSMTALLLNDTWTSVKPAISFSISKWIFVGSILMSFILLFLEMKKAYTIVKSGDISFSFTNKIAYRYYTLTSYAHWCFFQEIQDREKFFPDKVAFHVFFEFKGYKRLLLCDGPRQIINAITVYTILHDKKFSKRLSDYGSVTTRSSIAIMSFTVAVFAISVTILFCSFLVYLPLLCKIRGNLKEYCCHIIDKRIGQLLEKQRKVRIADANKKGQHQGPQPTIPTLDDNYPPQYNDPPPKAAFNFSEYPPDKLNYNNATAADQQGYYVQNPNIYQQQRDSTGVNSSRDSSSAPVFQNYNSSRRESISSATGPIYNERSISPGFNPRQERSVSPGFNPRQERSNSPGFNPRQERSNSPGFNPRQYPAPNSPPLIRQVNQPPYMQQSSQQLYQQRPPRIHNVAGPQSSMSSPIIRPQQPTSTPDSYYQGASAPIPTIPNVSGQYNQGASAPIPNFSGQYNQGASAPIPNISGHYNQGASAPIPNVPGQYNYDPSLDYYNNQTSQRQNMAYGQAYLPEEDDEISQNNMYSPQDQANFRRYDNYNNA